MKIELRPPTEMAGIHIGSTRAKAHDECSRLGSPKDFRRGEQEPASFAVRRSGGLSIFVYFDSDDRVNAIEVGRPDDDGDAVFYKDLDVFKTPAEDLIDRLRGYDAVEVDEQGCAVTAPDLLLALWRPVVPEGPDDPDGRYFESALIARPGYYA